MKEDFFDPDLVPDAPLLPSEADEVEHSDHEAVADKPAAGEEKKKRQLLGHDLSTLLIAGGAIVAALVYAMWPETSPSRGLIAEETPPVAQSQPVGLALIPLSEPSAPSPAPEPEPEPASDPEPAARPAEMDALRQSSAASLEAMAALSGRMDNVGQRLTDLETQLRALAARSAPAGPVATAASPGTAQKPRWAVKPVQPAKTSPATGSVNGWRVHTVYPGMAWITRDATTWAVQPGDVLQGFTVRSINAAERTVTTDKGVIRRGG